jgi:pSer/pThr/pTyr-binding forkhead associated (FHA) protein
MNPPQIVVQLIHIHGGLKGEIQDFNDQEITVGRLSTCAVKFPADEPGVSREHARIEREGNQFKLTDVSRFGTFVNGKQVKVVYLRSGDVIEFGPGGPKVSFTMEVAASSPKVAQASSLAPAAAPFAEPILPYRKAQMKEALAAAPPAPATAVVQPKASAMAAVPPPPAFAVPKAAAPLVIQFGPTIRTYRELPVVVGSHSGADFVLNHPGILDQHAQIFFQANTYWIRDLTGRGVVRVNLKAVADSGAPLSQNDEISCGPLGPVFRFLGEGRLAEVEQVEQAGEPQEDVRTAERDHVQPQGTGGFLSNWAKGLKRR